MNETEVQLTRTMFPRNARGVAAAWSAGKRLSAGNIRTDGQTCWSWGLLVAWTRDDGQKIAIDYRGDISDSTSRHCGLLMDHANIVVASAAKTFAMLRGESMPRLSSEPHA